MAWAKRVRVHAVPKFGFQDASYEARWYLASLRDKLINALPSLERSINLYGHPRPPGLQPLAVTAQIGDKIETVEIGLATGGHIKSWRSQDVSGSPYDVRWLNHNNGTGRALQVATAHFEGSGGGNYHNPTQAGSVVGTIDSAFSTLHTGYSENPNDCFQGGIVVDYSVHDFGNGQKLIKVLTLPLEWDFDGSDNGTDHNGSPHDAIIYTDSFILTELHLNWAGRTGLHRWRQRAVWPTEMAADTLADTRIGTSVHSTFVYGFDEMYSYDGSLVLQTDRQMYAANIAPAVVGAQVLAGTAFVQFASDTGRNDGTIHEVTLSGFSANGSGPNINGTHLATFGGVGNVLLSFPIVGSDDTYTLGTVTSPEVVWSPHEVDHAMFIRSDLHTLNNWTGGTLIAQEVASMLGTPGAARTGFFLRADGTAGYSLDTDFGAGIYAGGIDSNSAATKRFWNIGNTGIGVPPQGTETEAPGWLIQKSWSAEGQRIGPGKLETAAFFLSGTWAEVQANISWLDGRPDSEFGNVDFI